MSVQSVNSVDFQLHTLGWKNFQDLVGTIIAEIFGQDAKPFRVVKDGGQDGAYQGTWRDASGFQYAGSFTFQCKFRSREGTLRLSDVNGEKKNATSLASSHLADNYFLITNAIVAPEEQSKIEASFGSIAGIREARVFDGIWLTQRIRESARLRMLVPRVYGLGDLTLILNEQALQQSRAVLQLMGADLAKLVKTESHQRAAKAVIEHGFAILLGDPAVGKTTIAASLALGALDLWQAPTFVVRSVAEIVDRWNSNEPRQFFWFDDAFGSNQLDENACEQWNHAMRHLYAAVRGGARIVATSRTHIFSGAQRLLKIDDFPLLQRSQVYVQVASLNRREREQILYNHIRLGNQPKTVKAGLRPHLTRLANNANFTPEAARRLGDASLTPRVPATAELLDDFVTNQVPYMLGVLRTMDEEGFAALAFLFAHGNRLNIPIDISARGNQLLASLGASQGGVAKALSQMNGSFVKMGFDSSGPFWTYRHPTMRDAVAEFVSLDANLVDIYLDGTETRQLVKEIVVGEVQLTGAKVRLGQSRYDQLIERLLLLDWADCTRFLLARCDDEFLTRFLRKVPDFFSDSFSVRHRSYPPFYLKAQLAAEYHHRGLLPAIVRDSFAQTISRLAFDGTSVDSSIWTDDTLLSLLTQAERAELFDRLKEDFLGRIERLIELHAESWDYTSDPETYFDDLSEALSELQAGTEFDKYDTLVLERAFKSIEYEIDRMKPLQAGEPNYPPDDYDFYREMSADRADEEAPTVAIERDVFEDVAD